MYLHRIYFTTNFLIPLFYKINHKKYCLSSKSNLTIRFQNLLLYKAVYFTNKIQIYAKINYNNVSIVTTGCGRVSGV